MSRSLNPVLMSALIFPGAGHLALKRRGRASLFIVPVVMAVFFFAREVAAKITPIVDKIQNGELAPDPFMLYSLIKLQSSEATPFMNLCAGVIVACWIGAAIDAWFLTPHDTSKGLP